MVTSIDTAGVWMVIGVIFLWQSFIPIPSFHSIGLAEASLTDNLKYYETMRSSDLSHSIVKRGVDPTSTHKHNKIREVGFKVLGKEFRLILSPKKGLLHPKFKAVEIEELDDEVDLGDTSSTQHRIKEHRVPIDLESFYDGRVFGELKSRATVHMEDDGVLTAKIETPEETYHIEPSWRHLDPEDNQSMIAYRESDVILSWNGASSSGGGSGGNKKGEEEDFKHQPKMCDYIRENGTAVGMEDDSNLDDHETEFLGGGEKWESQESMQSRIKRQATGELYMDLRQTRCPLLLVADYRFFSEMGGGSSKTTVNYLISLIDRVHKIYEDTVW